VAIGVAVEVFFANERIVAVDEVGSRIGFLEFIHQLFGEFIIKSVGEFDDFSVGCGTFFNRAKVKSVPISGVSGGLSLKIRHADTFNQIAKWRQSQQGNQQNQYGNYQRYFKCFSHLI
jgi:hypothetical protein